MHPINLALVLGGLAVPSLPYGVAAQEVFDLVPIAPGVYAAEVVDRPPMYAFANSLVVIDTEGVLVVDTQQSPEAAQVLIERIRERTDLPVRWVVNTHWHADHLAGNVAYRTAFPDVEFIGHATLAEDVVVETEAWRRREIESLPATIAVRRRWLDEGTGPDGSMLDAEARADLRYSLRLREAHLETLRSHELVGPTRTFDRRLELDTGERTVRLLHLGPAHTRGDVVVHLPGPGVVAVGDLLEHGEPWTDGADVAGWANALETLAGLGASVYLPGHGPTVRDSSLLEEYCDFFDVAVCGGGRS